MASHKYNPEKRTWRGKSHKNGKTVRDLKAVLPKSESIVPETKVTLTFVSEDAAQDFCKNLVAGVAGHVPGSKQVIVIVYDYQLDQLIRQMCNCPNHVEYVLSEV